MATLHIDRLLETVVRTRASDLLLIPGRPPVLRIDCGLRSLETKALSADDTVALFEAIGTKQHIEQLKQHQHTHFAFAFGDAARFRVLATSGHAGMELVLHHVPTRLPTFDELRLPRILRALARRPRGLFLVVGPQSSGRTTVLAALVDYVNRQVGDRHIVTIEDPIEYVHPPTKAMITQREVGTHTPSFAEALADCRFQAADVLLLSRLDDAPTIMAAAEYASSGHLVFAAMNAGGAAETVKRLIGACPTDAREHMRGVLAGSLLGVLALRLCPKAGTEGVVLAHEFLVATPAISSLIHEDKLYRIDSAIQAGAQYGMQLLDNDLFQLFTEHVIGPECAIENSRAPADLQARIDRWLHGDAESEPGTSPFPVRPDSPPPGLSDEASDDPPPAS